MGKTYTAVLRSEEINSALTDCVLAKRKAPLGRTYSTVMKTTIAKDSVIIELTIRENKVKQ